MLSQIGSALGNVIGWIGQVVTALTDTTSTTPGALTPLLPLLAITCAVSGLMLAIRVIRSMIWGA